MSSGKAAQIPNKEELVQAAELAKAAKKAQDTADDLKRKAMRTGSTSERDDLLEESQRKEKAARAKSRESRRMASGAWQGAAAGAGYGAAVGAGLGAVVGTLVGAIAAIPTTGLGGLIGLPVGYFHGPFVKNDVPDRPIQGEMSEEQQHRAVLKAVEDAEKQEKQMQGDVESKVAGKATDNSSSEVPNKNIDT